MTALGETYSPAKNSIKVNTVRKEAGKGVNSKCVVKDRKSLRCEAWLAAVPGAKALVCLTCTRLCKTAKPVKEEIA